MKYYGGGLTQVLRWCSVGGGREKENQVSCFFSVKLYVSTDPFREVTTLRRVFVL